MFATITFSLKLEKFSRLKTKLHVIVSLVIPQFTKKKLPPPARDVMMGKSGHLLSSIA